MELLDLNKIALFEEKEIVSFSALKLNHPYPIKHMERVTTDHGKTLLVELEDFRIFIPKRISNSISDDVLERLLDSQLSLIYRGTKDVNKPNPAALFEFVKS